MKQTRGPRNRVLAIGACAVVVLIVVFVVLPNLVDINTFRPKLESEMSAALGRQVRIGNLSLSIFSGSVSADMIAIADDPAFSKDPFIAAKSFSAGVKIRPLIFSKTLHITEIKLEDPQITLLRGANHTWNFSTLGGKSETPAHQPVKADETPNNSLSVDKLMVDNGRVLVGTANSAEKPKVYDKVNLEVTNFSTTTQFPFTLTASTPAGGDLDMKGKCGPIDSGNAGMTPFEVSLALRKLNLAASGFVQASTGIQGLANFDGAIHSDGRQAMLTGTVTADRLKLAANGAPSQRTVAVKYAIHHNLKTDSGTVTQGDISIGKAVAHLTGSYQMQGQTTTLTMKLFGSDMPVGEIEAALPAVGVVLPKGAQLQGGSLSTDLAIGGPADKLTLMGPIRMSNVKLAGFDVLSKLSAIPGLSGGQAGGKDTTIENFSTTVRMAPEGTQANDINLTIPTLGAVTGAGTIGSSGALNFKMNAILSAASGIVQKAGIGGKDNSVPFSITGTTSDPKFAPEVKAIIGNVVARELSGTEGKTAVDRITGLFHKK
jgi:AsmA protein